MCAVTDCEAVTLPAGALGDTEALETVEPLGVTVALPLAEAHNDPDDDVERDATVDDERAPELEKRGESVPFDGDACSVSLGHAVAEGDTD